MKGGDAMNTHERLQQLMDERGWSMYRLSKESGLSESTIRNLFKRNTSPSIETLEMVCKGFGITLSQFFAEGEMVEMTPELKEIFNEWLFLTPEQKQAIKQMLHAMRVNWCFKTGLSIMVARFFIKGTNPLIADILSNG